jgi:hypothetical protein
MASPLTQRANQVQKKTASPDLPGLADLNLNVIPAKR